MALRNAHKWAFPSGFAAGLGRKGTWYSQAPGGPRKPAPACPPVPSARAAPSLAAAGRARRPISAAGSCPRRRRAAPRCRQGRARAAANLFLRRLPCRRLGASRPGVGPLARRPTGSTPGSPRVCRGLRLSIRAPAAGGAALPWGSRQLSHPAPPAAAPPCRANSASQLAAALPPRASPLLLPSFRRLLCPPRSSLLVPPRPPSASSPFRRPRARGLARLEGARLPGPQPPQPTPSTGTLARAARSLSSYTYPPTSPGPSSCAQTFPGPNVVPGEGPPAPADRAPPVRPCTPANWVTALRHQAAAARGSPAAISAGQLARVHGGGDPEGDRPSPVPPRLRRKVSGPPPAPALPGPLMGGICQQI
ncbi:hypothetical protein V6Z77_010206 [Aspergillus fumigatus]